MHPQKAKACMWLRVVSRIINRKIKNYFRFFFFFKVLSRFFFLRRQCPQMGPKRASEGKWIFQAESDKKPSLYLLAACKAAPPTWN